MDAHTPCLHFRCSADVISQALMGLNFTLNHPHCPQRMTNAQLSPALQSCRAVSGRHLPLLPHTPFWPPRRGSLGPLGLGTFTGQGNSPGVLWESQGSQSATKGDFGGNKDDMRWGGKSLGEEGGWSSGLCLWGPAGLLPSEGPSPGVMKDGCRGDLWDPRNDLPCSYTPYGNPILLKLIKIAVALLGASVALHPPAMHPTPTHPPTHSLIHSTGTRPTTPWLASRPSKAPVSCWTQ